MRSYADLLDPLLPAELRDGPVETRRRARLVLGAAAIASGVTTCVSLLLFVLGTPQAALVEFSLAIPHFLAIALLYYSKSVRIAGHYLTLVIAAQIAIDLGPDAGFGILATVALPLVATNLINVRGGIVWSFIAIGWAVWTATSLDDPTARNFAWDVVIMTVALALAGLIIEGLRASAVAEADGAKRRLEQQREQVRGFIQNTFPIIAEVGVDGIHSLSDGVEGILGYSVAEILDRPLLDLVHPEDTTHILASVEQRMATGAREEIRVRHRDGHWLHLEVVSIPEGDSGEQWVIGARDITDEIRLREHFMQTQRQEGVGVLAAAVAHDFNNLLTVISGLAEAVPEGETRDQMFTALADATRIATQLTQVGQAGDSSPERLDLVELLKGMESVIRSAAGENIEVHVDGIERAPVEGNASELRQVILNLVQNARDAMPAGGHLSVLMDCKELDEREARSLGLETEEYVHLSIVDTGGGMPRETLRQAFDPFFTTKPDPAGAGLGLTSAIAVVRKYGGNLLLESTPGQGTSATVLLPVAEKPADREVPVNVQPLSQGRGEAVLLAEDSEHVRVVAEHMLTTAGYRVWPAGSGAQALNYVKAGQLPDVLVTDVVMPGMRGSVLATAIKRRCPDCKIIFISGYADVDLGDWLARPDVRYLAKPFRAEELTREIRDLLDQKVDAAD